MRKNYELVVIGSGPGGTRAAIQAAKAGKRVALIEKGKLGGFCVHTGTIPSKSLREAALRPGKTNFLESMARMRSVLEGEVKLAKEQLTRNKVDLYFGTASFLDSHSLEVRTKSGKETIGGSAIVIATGTRPIRHAEFPFGKPGLYDSDGILKLKKLPKKMLVIGAGVIGCEYASIFARLGSKVTLADRRNELLRSVDLEVVDALKSGFEGAGVRLLLVAKIGKIVRGSANLELELNGKREKFESILVCMGRQPNVEELGLAKVAVALNERGFVKVDADYRSSVPHIYAVGDVIGPPALAAASAEQGRIAACRIFGLESAGFPSSFPYGIYTIPEISSVGLLETELKEKAVPYVVGRAGFFELARGLIVGEKEGFIKLLVHRETRRLLGIHVIGHGATELIHIGQIAFALEAPVDFLVTNIFNYPTFAEAYKVAALRALNQLR